MKANELRIGNYIIEDGEIDQVTEGHFWHEHEFCDDCISKLKPIPLTEEWLKNFGFEKFSGNTILWGLSDFCIGWYGNSFATWIIILTQKNNQMRFHSQIKYVHQLQNLYFALTGEELQ